MNRQLIIAIAIGLSIVMIPQSRYVYCELMNRAVVIPVEYRKKLVNNQMRIDNLKEQAGKVYAENQELLNELLAMNKIVKKAGEEWIIKLENGIWEIYKK